MTSMCSAPSRSWRTLRGGSTRQRPSTTSATILRFGCLSSSGPAPATRFLYPSHRSTGSLAASLTYHFGYVTIRALMHTHASLSAQAERGPHRMTGILDEQYLTIAQAAERLHVNKSTIRRWIDQGTLPAYKVGQRRVALRTADVARLITPARRT